MENYYEIMREAMEAEDKRDRDINEKNQLIIKSLLEIKGFDFVSNFLYDFVENECNGEIEFCEKPKGEKQSDYWGKSKGVWVEQYCEIEDSYWGYIYFPIGADRWIKCHFAC